MKLVWLAKNIADSTYGWLRIWLVQSMAGSEGCLQPHAPIWAHGRGPGPNKSWPSPLPHPDPAAFFGRGPEPMAPY